MIALDLDNTLLNRDKVISHFNEKILRQLHRNGIRIVLCTGRPLKAVEQYIDQLGLNTDFDFTITFNGALVLNNATKKILFKHTLAKEDFRSLYQFAKNRALALGILDFKRVYPIIGLKEAHFNQHLRDVLQFVPTSFDDLKDIGYSKALMPDNDPKKLDDVQQNLPEDIKNRYHVVRSQPHLMEYLAPKMDKAVGLAELLKHLHLNFDQLMAFGDAENDAGMIKKAEKGIAMANAQPEIKSIADDQTLTNDEDGVGVYLKHYFNL
ncbi:Cof-type HAD-IIB family hydrolase [Philodulcilactobacillus myokoensis]|nr:Cof-type HAD-IIB family hydrolase [Philodulcilactobacillus myokoensis]